MESNDKQRFARALGALCAVFGHEIDAPARDGYWLALSDLPIEQVEAACTTALREFKWFPKPAELRTLLAPPSAKSRALDAWPEVMKAAAGNGKITDPIAQRAVNNMGGAKRLGQMEEETLREWGRKRFEELYQDACEQGEIRGRLGAPDETKQIPEAVRGLMKGIG